MTSLGGEKGPIQQKVFFPFSSTDPYWVQSLLQKLLGLLKLTAYFAYGSLFCRAAPAGLSRRSHEQTVGKGKYKILQEKLRAGKVILPYPC